MDTRKTDVRELELFEIDAITGAGYISDAVDKVSNWWNKLWTQEVKNPVDQCPQCFTGGGGVRG